MASDIQRKRDCLKSILYRQYDRAQNDGRSAFANLIYGMIVRTDAGRYDDRLDVMIAEKSA